MVKEDFVQYNLVAINRTKIMAVGEREIVLQSVHFIVGMAVDMRIESAVSSFQRAVIVFH